MLQVLLEAFLEVFLEVFLSTEGCLEVTARLGGAWGLPGESSPQTFPDGGLELVPVGPGVVLGRVLVFTRGCLFLRPLYLFPGLEVAEVFSSNMMPKQDSLMLCPVSALSLSSTPFVSSFPPPWLRFGLPSYMQMFLK